MKVMVSSFKRPHACTASLSAPKPAAGPHRPTPPPETPGHSRASPGPSPVGSPSFLLGPGAQGPLSLPEPVSQAHGSSAAPWWVNGNLLPGLVPHPHPEPVPAQTPPTRAPEETPKHSPSQSLWGAWVLGAQGLHERSERLWWERGLILNANAPSHRLARASPSPSDVGHLLTAAPAPTTSGVSLTLDVGISSWLVQQSVAAAPALRRGGSSGYKVNKPWGRTCGMLLWLIMLYFVFFESCWENGS